MYIYRERSSRYGKKIKQRSSYTPYHSNIFDTGFQVLRDIVSWCHFHRSDLATVRMLPDGLVDIGIVPAGDAEPNVTNFARQRENCLQEVRPIYRASSRASTNTMILNGN